MSEKKAGAEATDQKNAIEQWKVLIQTQIHFNDMILRTRSLVVTVVLAAYGAAAASFAQLPEKYVVTSFGFFHVSVAITFFAICLLVAFFALDYFYYHRLLMSAVTYSEEVEKQFDLPIKQTCKLSSAVPTSRVVIAVSIYYGIPLTTGFIFMWYVFKMQQPWMGP